VAGWTLWQHRALDLMSIGGDVAASRGVAVQRVVLGSFVLTGVLTGVIVASCGPIGFVGLMVPHIVRALVGVQTAPLVAGSLLTGAAFLALSDGVARAAFPFELPVGILTNILGAGFFLYLLLGRGVHLAR
jgi:iron complex transport system permease protein